MQKLRTALQIMRTEGLRRALYITRVKFNRLRVVEFGIRGFILPWRIRHICGPRHIDYGFDELIVICVVRNGEPFVKSFLDHYRSIGVKHFVFLDNGSSDRTIETLRSNHDVTLLQTLAPYDRYENAMKAYLAKEYSMGRWCICADIDELFDYPFSGSLRLSDFLGYLNRNRYTAVITQMLDMFADVSLTQLNSDPNDILKEKYRCYDISAVEKSDYLGSPNGDIKMHFGGIRKVIFNANNWLTKVSLIRMDGTLRPFVNWHHTENANVADISCVLMHYPFVSTFPMKVQEAAQSGRYGSVATEVYKSYRRTLKLSPEINMKLKTARVFTNVEDLVASGFLAVSDRYMQWVRSYAHSARPERS